MYHVPMCVVCGEKEVQIAVNSVGSGYCSEVCVQIADAEEEAKYHGTFEYNPECDGWRVEDIEWLQIPTEEV